jgi:GT2 family glycosyltransferase
VIENYYPHPVDAYPETPCAPESLALHSDGELLPLPCSLDVERSNLDTDPLVRADAERRTVELSREIELLRSHINSLQSELGRAHADLERTRARSQALGLHVFAYETSTSWSITSPLRNLGHRFPAAARLTRRTAKAIWWTVTLQLGNRLQARRQVMLAEAQRRASETRTSARRKPITTVPIETKIRVVSAAEPVVSVIIPTFGHVDYTLRCLASISEHTPRAAIEVIVLDDAYPGSEVSSLWEKVDGIRLVRNPENRGFLLTCNAGAKLAKGDYLFFLNNDTELLPGAIDALAELLDANAEAGMAGSKLLYPDGRLQEAGGIIWNDASAWNWGRYQDPARPEFNYRREVDYISGAAIMVRRSVFMELGGFDPEFAPAYCEDSDLAFRIRALGLKVVYEPRSEVVHYEGVSHGTDTTDGVKAYQAANAALLRSRWQDILARDHYANGQSVLRARDRARHRTVILVVDHYVPEPDCDAGSRTIMGLLEGLLAANWVVKFWPQNRQYSSVYTSALEAMGIEVLDGRWPGDIAAWLDQNGDMLDHVLVSRPSVATDLLAPIMSRTSARLSFYGHDLHFARIGREAEVTGNDAIRSDAAEMELLERRLWRLFDTVIYPSEEEAAIVRAMEPQTNACAIVPYCFDQFRQRERAIGSHTILFVAGFAHLPNVDAAQFLVQEVLPLIHAELPDARVVLAGSHPSAAVRSLAGPGVEVTGWISDAQMARYYRDARVAAVPLRFGAGVKRKVVEALSEGLPLVTTPTGAQGLPGLDQIIPVHRSATDLARELLRLLRDDAAWMAQSRAQVQFAESKFSRAAMQTSLLRALGHLNRGSMERGCGDRVPIGGERLATSVNPVCSMKRPAAPPILQAEH